MFKKMLVATDLSSASEQVVCALGSLKKLGTDEAVLINCFNIRDVGTLAPGLMELSKPAFQKQQKQLEEMGFKVTAEMVLGLPQIEINRQAVKHGCSFIVVGSHGHNISGDVLLGGTASAVIRDATLPVLILRLNGNGENGDEPPVCNFFGHALFPTDFSDNAERAFSFVEELATSGLSKVTLMHVQDKQKIEDYLKERLDEFNEIDRGRLERMADRLRTKGCGDVGLEIVYGHPKKEVVERANRGDISLVVMGSQGRGFFNEILLGSVSHETARRSKVPVFLVPAKR